MIKYLFFCRILIYYECEDKKRGGTKVKKSSIVWLIVAIVLVVVIVVGGMIFSTIFFSVKSTLDEALTEKVALTSDQFKANLEERGYQIVDATNQISDSNIGQYKKVYLAIDSEMTYQIEFHEFTDSTYAQNIYSQIKNALDTTRSNNSTYTNIDGINFNKYTATDTNAYAIVSRIDNTVMYALVYDNYKDVVNSIFETYNY